MTQKLKFADVKEYFDALGLEIKHDLSADNGYIVEYSCYKQYKRPRHYQTLHNALVFNAPGGNDADVLGRFEKWRLARWQQEATR